MKLVELVINGLFGNFNHNISFNENSITIITAPNGYGKTICLKIIEAIFNKRLSFLCDLEFTLIEIETSKGVLKIEKDIENTPDKISLGYTGVADKYEYSSAQSHNKKSSAIVRAIEQFIPFLDRVGPRNWVNHKTDEFYSIDEIIENFGEYLPEKFKKYPDWYIDFSSSLDVHFIQDQRLIQRTKFTGQANMRSYIGSSRNVVESKNFVDTIEKFADDLAKLIRKSDLASSHVSQKLDSTFPDRLLRTDAEFSPLEIEELKEELQKLQSRRSDLSKYNLLASTQLSTLYNLSEIKSEDKKVLTLYVEDTKEKLASYDDIYKKIKLFSRILNKNRLSFKEIKIDSEKGFFFETKKEKVLELTQLSSGEQHQVVLLYELIFKTEKNILVLIDEPEISLHVAWQKQFLKDLQAIIEIQDMPVIIATHSPQIIDGNWDLTVDLAEGGVA